MVKIGEMSYLSAHKSNKIYNEVQNIWFPLPTYSVNNFQNSVSEKNVVLLNFCLCVYILYAY